nr:hypothetical protein [Tanacetum cinerariifolium]
RANNRVVLALTSFLLFCISSVVIATVLPFFLAELSLAEPVPDSSRGAWIFAKVGFGCSIFECILRLVGSTTLNDKVIVTLSSLKCKLLQQGQLSSGNTSSLAVAKYSSSGIFITGSENDLSILFPTLTVCGKVYAVTGFDKPSDTLALGTDFVFGKYILSREFEKEAGLPKTDGFGIR